MTHPLALHQPLDQRGASFEMVGGREVPASVAGADAEYAAIRQGAGITDRSSWRIFRLTGPNLFEVLDATFTAEVGHLAEDVLRPSLLLDDQGGFVADVWLWIQRDAVLVLARPLYGEPLAGALAGLDGIGCEDLSDTEALIALEGPRSRFVVGTLCGAAVMGLSFLTSMSSAISGVAVEVAQMSVTGEIGYLVRCPRESAAEVLAAFESSGETTLCGEAITEVLSTEVRAFRAEWDLARGEHVLEAGLHWMIAFWKPQFCGREALLNGMAAGRARRLMAFIADAGQTPQQPPQPGAPLTAQEREVGYVVRAAHSPHLGKTVGLAYVASELAWVGVSLDQAGQSVRLVSSPALREPERASVP